MHSLVPILLGLLLATPAPTPGPAPESTPAPVESQDAPRVEGTRPPISKETRQLLNDLASRPVRVVLVMAGVEGGSPAPFLDLLGDTGIFVDTVNSSARDGSQVIYRITGRAGEEDSVNRLVAEGKQRSQVELLWVATALVPPGATEPIPLDTIVWSPRLYPSKGSMVNVGPTGRPVYYVPGTAGEIVEGNWDGKEFRTAYYSLQRPPYIEGSGGPSMNLSRLGWTWRVASWLRQQDAIRDRGWEKYGYIFEKDEAEAGEPEGK